MGKSSPRGKIFHSTKQFVLKKKKKKFSPILTLAIVNPCAAARGDLCPSVLANLLAQVQRAVRIVIILWQVRTGGWTTTKPNEKKKKLKIIERLPLIAEGENHSRETYRGAEESNLRKVPASCAYLHIFMTRNTSHARSRADPLWRLPPPIGSLRVDKTRCARPDKRPKTQNWIVESTRNQSPRNWRTAWPFRRWRAIFDQGFRSGLRYFFRI